MTGEIPEISAEDVRRLLQEHEILWTQVKPLAEDTNEKMGIMFRDLYGQHTPTPTDPDHHTGGRLARLDVVANGGIRVKVPAWLTAMIVALMGMVATIMAAIVAAVAGS